MRIAMLGLGLIGGSVARAVRERQPDWRVGAWTPRGDGPARAAAEGVVEPSDSLEAAVDGADLVVLAAPPLACLALLDRLATASLAPAAVVTDVASTKRQLAERAGRLGVRFVGGHPMTGRETTGYESSDGQLFLARPWVVCPPEPPDPDAVARVEVLATSVGARPIRMSPDAHDAAVGGISHLPLVLSAVLAEAVAARAGVADERTAERQLAAGGWRDMTRLARGDVEMGAGILAMNADEVATRLRAVRAVIDGWLADLEGEPGDHDAAAALRDRLAAARTALGAE